MRNDLCEKFGFERNIPKDKEYKNKSIFNSEEVDGSCSECIHSNVCVLVKKFNDLLEEMTVDEFVINFDCPNFVIEADLMG